VTIATRRGGRAGAEVPVLGTGQWNHAACPGRALTDDEAGQILSAVLDSGINLIDTSVDYRRSEELIGRHVGQRRDEYFLASKCGCPLNLPADAMPQYQHDWSPANVRADVEQSLPRLGTDRPDLVQVHISPSRAQLPADRHQQRHSVRIDRDGHPLLGCPVHEQRNSLRGLCGHRSGVVGSRQRQRRHR
jgi:aryl-alcohol dehydrogenase-like predicted oxidoreductase